jgi:nickel transport protein
VPRVPVLVTLFVLCPLLAAAHGVDHEVASTPAVSVIFRYTDGAPLVFADVEVHGPGDRRPAAVGLTDRAGRALFVPDRPGAWTVRVRTEDGHGDLVTVDVGPELLTATGTATPGRPLRALLAIALILALALLLSRVLGSRRHTGGSPVDPGA